MFMAQVIEKHSMPKALRAFVETRAGLSETRVVIDGHLVVTQSIDWDTVDIEGEIGDFSALYVGWFSSSEEYVRSLPGVSDVWPTLLKRLDFDHIVECLEWSDDILTIQDSGRSFWVFAPW